MKIIAIHSLAKEMLLTKSCKKLYEDTKELINIDEQIESIKIVYKSMDYDTQLALYNKANKLVDRSKVLIEESDNLRNAINLLDKMWTP
ncbi:MAG: hypothetical protein J6Y02_12945 [Pseudobutyrivibrio sp.]|nr:hypothetical protein [Pseudobutyrivibrio sp.]